MVNEDLGKLSPEQLQKLGRVISEAKDLTNQQAEIIEKVLAGEEDIGKLRISYLNEYFDIYSKKLDSVARKYKDDLNDVFLILDKKLTDSYKKLENISSLDKKNKPKAEQADKQSKQIAGSSAAIENTNKKLDTTNRELQKLSSAITELSGVIKSNTTNVGAKSTGSKTTKTSPSTDITTAVDGSRSINYSVSYDETNITAAIRNAINTARYGTNDVAEGIAATSETAQNNNVTTAVSDTVSTENREKMLDITQETIKGKLAAVQQIEIDAQREKQNKEHLERLLKNAEAAHEAMIKLEIAKYRTEEELENQRLEQRIAYLDEVTKAEREAQELINKIDMQLSGDENKRSMSDIEAGELRAKEANAKLDVAAYKELERQMAEYRAELDRKYIIENGELTAEAAADNEVLLREEFADREERLEKIRAKLIADEKQATEKKGLSAIDPKLAARQEAAIAKYKKELELEARRKNGGKLTAEDAERIDAQAEERYKIGSKAFDRLAKLELNEQNRAEKEEKRQERVNERNKINSVATGPLNAENNLLKRLGDLSVIAKAKADTGNGTTGANVAGALDTAIVALSSLAAQLNDSIDKIAEKQGGIDTRLQGSNNTKYMGSYWGQLTRDMMSVGAVTPFFKQEDFSKNIETLVDKGIAFDLKQRAFLMTIQEKIANTFNVADGTLLRLIRLQQEDSTAGRLGMESALNSFLNNMYENTEYLKDVAASVRGSLQEMEALMTGAAATEVEYQVQKWMGSLYSVGMSQDAVQGIANALGQIAAGQIEGLTSGNGAGNLLVMAANNAGIPIADILSKGLDAEDTNKLLQATVDYLAEIANSTKDNNVVQQQLAGVFGVKASDLRAATNLATPGTTKDIFGEYKTYDNMLYRLNEMAGTMYQRTSIGEMMSNIWANGQYTLASSMSSNPIAYLTYKLASVLEDTTGGITLPDIMVMGSGVQLNTTVADLMRVGAMSAGILGSLGPMISGLAGSFSGQAMLTKMGISSGSGLTVTPRGEGGIGSTDNAGGGQQTTSGSGYVGNSSGSDIKNATIQEAEDSKKQQMIEALEEEPANQVDMINSTVLKIYELLDNVTKGNQTLRVRVDSYGLTGSNSTGGSQGGVTGLLNNTGAYNSNDSTNNSTSVDGLGISRGGTGAAELGGWTMM